jgi:hypothetical protein
VVACTPALETQPHGFQKDGHLPGSRIVGGQFAIQKPVHLRGVLAIVVGNIARGRPQTLQFRAEVPKVRRDHVQDGRAGNRLFALLKALLEHLPGDPLDLQQRAAKVANGIPKCPKIPRWASFIEAYCSGRRPMGLANGTEGRSNERLRSSAVRQSRDTEAHRMDNPWARCSTFSRRRSRSVFRQRR